MRVVFDISTGEITAIVSQVAGALEGFDVAEIANIGMTVDQTHYMIAGGDGWVPTPRPELPAWPGQMAAPATLDMAALPAGTTVIATNEAGETAVTSNPLDPVVLTGASGVYRIEAVAPFPWIILNQTVETI